MATIRSLIVKIGGDVTNLEQALGQAVSKTTNLSAALKNVGDGDIGKNAQASFDRLTKTMQGVVDQQQRMADTAQLAARGIDFIGGPAKLTSTQLDQMNRVLQQGLDAFRALGQEAPSGLQNVAAAVQQQQKALADASTSTKGFFSAFTELGQSWVARITEGVLLRDAIRGIVNSLVDLGEGAIQDAVSYGRLATATGLTTDAVQRFGVVGRDFGVSTEEMARGVEQLSSRLAGGDKSAIATVEGLGLSLRQLLAAGPEEAFIQIADAVNKVQDPMVRSADRTALFGERLGRVIGQLPDLRKSIDDVSGSEIISDDAIKKLTDAEQGIQHIRDQIKAAIAEGALKLLNLGGGVPAPAPAPQPTFGAAIGPLPNLSSLGAQFGAVNADSLKTDAGLAALQNRVKALTEEWNNLTASEKQQIATGFQLKDSAQSIAASLHLDPTTVERFFADLQKAQEAAKKLAEATAQVSQAVGGFGQVLASLPQGPLDLKFNGNELTGTISQVVLALKDAEVPAEAIQTFLHLTQTQYTAIIEQAKVHADILKLEAGQAGALSDVLSKIGTLDDSEIQRLKDQLSIREALNKVERDVTVGQINVGALGPQANDNELGQVKEQIDKLTQAQKDFEASLNDLTRSFLELGRAGSGAFGAIIQTIGRAGTAISNVERGIKAFNQDVADGARGAAALAGVSIGVSVVSAGVDLVSSLASAFTTPGWKKVENDVARDFGAAISQQTAQSIDDLAHKLGTEQLKAKGLSDAQVQTLKDFGFNPTDRQAAATLSLPSIIQDAGGLNSFGVDNAISKTRDLFAELQAGRITIGETKDAFDQLFGQLAPAAIEKTTGLAKASFVELITLSNAAGTQSQAVADFVTSQLQTAQTGLQTFLEHASKQDFTASAAEGVGGAIAAIVKSAQAQGQSLLSIFAQLQPVLDKFETDLRATGQTGGAAFANIQAEADLARDKIAGPVIQSIDGLGQTLASLANVGGLDQATFTGLTDSIAESFDKLVASGKDAGAVLQLLAPRLQTIFELQERGFQVDPQTQALLDQAKSKGLIGDQFKSAADKTVDALNDTNKILEAIATKLGAVLPQLSSAVSSIPDTIAVNVTNADQTSFGAPPVLPSTGGLVLGPGRLQRFADGGRVLPFLARGTDTVPAMLTPGEIVLNAAQQQSVANALSGGSSVNISVDARGALLDSQGIDRLTNKIVDSIHRGTAQSKVNVIVKRAS